MKKTITALATVLFSLTLASGALAGEGYGPEKSGQKDEAMQMETMAHQEMEPAEPAAFEEAPPEEPGIFQEEQRGLEEESAE